MYAIVKYFKSLSETGDKSQKYLPVENNIAKLLPENLYRQSSCRYKYRSSNSVALIKNNRLGS